MEHEINLASDDESMEFMSTEMQLQQNVSEKNKQIQEDVGTEAMIEEELVAVDANSVKCSDSGELFLGEEPRIGMIFKSDNEAYHFYNAYARKVGFSIRKKNVSIKKGILKYRELCCSLEGSYRKKWTPKKQRDSRRCGCLASMAIKLDEESKNFAVYKFVQEHNHPLEKLESLHLLRSHRHIEPTQYNLIQNMRSSGMKTVDIFSYLSTEAGGAENLNFTRRDCYNIVTKNRTEFLTKGDSQCLLQYLRNKQEANKCFFYELRTDDDNRICACFIADAKSRCDYSNFGDVICFDTTYKTNQYNMICAPIIGVNHHAQTVLFGCGLLDCETTDSFVWLFQTFLAAMGGKHPKTIFTDQAAAIANAISQVFPHTHHRLCLWHIYQNAAKHLSSYFSKYQLFSRDLKRCIYDPETVEEFEENWKMMLTNYDLQDNDWLRNLYVLKEKWAQVFGRDHFCAGMTTTQRSESINKFLKKFFLGNHILREFVAQFDKALADRRLKEKERDVRNRQTRPILITDWDVEREASMKYTRKIFQQFQDEYKKCLVLKLILEKDDGCTQYYNVKHMKREDVKTRSVTYMPSDESVTCSCKKFVFHGIPCAHMLKLFNELAVSSLPSYLYLSRWSMDVVSNIVYDSRGEVISPDLDPMQTRRYSRLSHLAQTVAAKASWTDEMSSIVESELLIMLTRIDSLAIKQKDAKTIGGSNEPNYGEPDEDTNTFQSGVRAPLQNPITKKRIGAKTRLKNVLEKRTKKKKDDGEKGTGSSGEKRYEHSVTVSQNETALSQQAILPMPSIISTQVCQPFMSFTALLQGTEIGQNTYMPVQHHFNSQSSSNAPNNLVGQPSSAKRLDFRDSS